VAVRRRAVAVRRRADNNLARAVAKKEGDGEAGG